ncbi:MAG: hypothetical protein JMN25_13105 [gamma proteobacterium endosymbiont of Lamellibrachia anaximandri]|nr:hypothetical protein [gamma proteobacterium endosymbiont of Lamellibrachia anaximandri]
MSAFQTAAGSSADLRVHAGLLGKFQPGTTSEIGVEIASPQATRADLSISDANGRTIHHLQLNEHARKKLWLGIKPKKDGSVTITLTAPSKKTLTHSITLTATRLPITLVSIAPGERKRSTAQLKTAEESAIVMLSSAGFPHTTQGYGAVQSVITDLESLAALEQRQSEALGQYLAGCGILLLDKASSSVIERLGRSAGCAGQLIRSYDQLSEIPQLLQQLDELRPPRLPESKTLALLTTSQPHLAVPLYLFGYLLLMVLLSSLLKRPALLLALPLLTAATGLVVWYGTGGQQLTLWAEAETGDPIARLAAIQYSGGDRRGFQETTFTTDMVITRLEDQQTSTPIERREGNDLYHLTSDTMLFEPVRYRLDGIVRQPHRFSLLLDNGQPIVRNTGTDTTPAGRLLWKRHSYALPALSPDETWHPELQGERPSTPAERLLSRRLSFNSAALLIPISQGWGGFASSATSTTGWLVIRSSTGGRS